MDISNIDNDLEYSLIFDVSKDSPIETNKFIEGMKDCLLSFELMNEAIASSINPEIEIVSYIQELEGGSIKYILRDFVKENGFEIGSAVAGVGGAIVTGDPVGIVTGGISSIGLSVKLSKTLKEAKKQIIEINNQQELTNEEREEKIYSNTNELLNKSEIQPLGIYSLDKEKLSNSVKNFNKGVIKTNKNVWYQEKKDGEKIYIKTTDDYIEEIEIEEGEKIHTKEEKCNIRIIKPDLEGKSKWECYWNKRIKCSIEDSDFIEKVKEGLKIGRNMEFFVLMKVEDVFDKYNYPIEDKQKFTILKILTYRDLETPKIL